MKKLITLLVAITLPLFANAAKYQEGEQYTQINETISAKPEVREFFSFYCPHCFRFEPIIEKLREKLPKEVKFDRNHVDFLHGATPEVQQMLSKALVVAELLKQEKKLAGAIFNYIQVQRAPFADEKDVRNLFVLNGVDGDKFDKLMKSFTVNAKAKQMKQRQDEFSKRGVLTGVPTIIVNNKYRVNLAKLDRNNFEQDFYNLVDYLLTLK